MSITFTCDICGRSVESFAMHDNSSEIVPVPNKWRMHKTDSIHFEGLLLCGNPACTDKLAKQLDYRPKTETAGTA
jgi:hypothetical protein